MVEGSAKDQGVSRTTTETYCYRWIIPRLPILAAFIILLVIQIGDVMGNPSEIGSFLRRRRLLLLPILKMII